MQHDIAKRIQIKLMTIMTSINIHMLKICGLSIYKSQETLLKQCGEIGASPSELEKDNIVPIHKKKTIKN